MSPSKLKSFSTGLFLAIVVAVSGSVMAQDGLRLFKPYGPESFGGGRRGTDGLYSSVSGIYWSISTPTGGYIGATTVKGKDETRLVYNVETSSLRSQTNSAKINLMSPTTTLGTRFEVGNRRGHHGWLVSGYGLPRQSHQFSATNVSMTMRDEGSYVAPAGTPVWGNQTNVGFLWGPNFGMITVPKYILQDDPVGWLNEEAGIPEQITGWLPNPAATNPDNAWIHYIGPGGTETGEVDSRIIYAYLPVGARYYLPGWEDEPGPPIIAPLPVAFDSITVDVRTSHLSAELVHTYRLNPFTWGGMELLTGARYWEMNDEFGLGAANHRTDTADAGTANTYGPVRAFENLRVDARGMNRVFGPQFGIKLQRHNARWTFGAEGRLTAGINAQALKSVGYVTPHIGYTPIGMQTPTIDWDNRVNAVHFGHRKNKTVFSPIGELRLTADWQWTNAISFFGALDGMFASNIARGVRVTDYVVSNDAIFGIRGNDRNTTVLVYGVEAGIKVRR